MSIEEQYMKGCLSVLLVVGFVMFVGVAGVEHISKRILEFRQVSRDVVVAKEQSRAIQVRAESDKAIAEQQTNAEFYRQRGETWREFWRQLSGTTVAVHESSQVTQRVDIQEKGLTTRYLAAVEADRAVGTAPYRFPFLTIMGVIWSFMISCIIFLKVAR
jgi:hypothetical protein